MLDLVVQSSQNAAQRTRVIVLHELGRDSRFFERTKVIALEEKPSCVAEHARLDQQHVR